MKTLICEHCGNPFQSGEVVNDNYCSRGCSIIGGISTMSAPSVTSPVSQKPIQQKSVVINQGIDDEEEEEEEEEGDTNWRDTGIKFEAITEKALARDKYKTGTRGIILAGHGASLSVKHNSLIIQHGISYMPHEVTKEELDKAMHDVDRIVWLDASGNISYAALSWCYKEGINLTILDHDGNTICDSCPGNGDIMLKRQQYTLPNDRAIDIAKWLILEKVQNQQAAYQMYPELHNTRTSDAFTVALNWLAANPTPEWLKDVSTIRLYEARVAQAYFASWKNIPLKWAKTDKNRIPNHWRIVGDRTSPLANGNSAKNAVSPAQAILNYTYGMLERVARAALLSCGFDISVGILHADRIGRDSLIYDLMELGRGTIDAAVLSFIKKIEFRKADFIQVVDGTVRLHPELARAVIATCSISPDVLIDYAKILKEKMLTMEIDK